MSRSRGGAPLSLVLAAVATAAILTSSRFSPSAAATAASPRAAASPRVASSPRAAVAYVSKSACLRSSATVVRAQFALPASTTPSASSAFPPPATRADGRAACDAVRQLAPELLGGFLCGSEGTSSSAAPPESHPGLAIFTGNLLGGGARALFPFVQNGGASPQGVSPQRIGEFSFELPRADHDPPHFAERVLYNDGKIGSWTTTLCSGSGPEVGGLRPQHEWWGGRSRASFRIEGSGFHQKVVAQLDVDVHGLTDGNTGGGCRLAVAYTMDETHYMDLDELRELEPYSGAAPLSGSWAIDVERPKEQSHRHLVTLRTTSDVAFVAAAKDGGRRTLSHTFEAPLHFRYQRVRPVEESNQAQACVMPPRVFLGCRSQSSSDGDGRTWQLLRRVTWLGGNYTRKSVRLCVDVPVGNSDEHALVMWTTALATTGAALFVWSAIWNAESV